MARDNALALQSWMNAPETVAVMAALATGGSSPRFVGGCVRDAIAGRDVSDIDISTPEKPEVIVSLLTDAGIKSVPTGIEHGTITAVIGAQSFEITTLRRDVETDGRHAVVAFTDDWVEDSSRRDFTFNAIYCDADGTLFDPQTGLVDLKDQRVRFVGDAATRIEEDALRILRFFRFQAQFSEGEVDAVGLAACIAAAQALKILSGERIAKEMFKLLACVNPLPVIERMWQGGVLQQIIPESTDVARLTGLCALDHRFDLIDSVRRLCALCPEGAATAARWRLSSRDSKRLSDAASPPPGFNNAQSEHQVRRAIYRFGADRVIDWILLAWAREPDNSDWQRHLELARQWQPPVLPIKGQDILDLGVDPGPRVGEVIKQIEDWWIEREFAPDRDQCLSKAREIL